MTDAPSRPVLRWHGGKWRLAPWIISYFPPHRVYVEPFGGAASVLIRKPRAYAEIYNDLDEHVVNLFRILRDEGSAQHLCGLLRLTPFARGEFVDAWQVANDPIEAARQLVVRSYMGFGSSAHGDMSAGAATTGFRASSNRSGTTPAHDWCNYPDALQATISRRGGGVVENRPAMDVLRQHDSATTLHYVDPPYLPETRGLKNPYDLKHRYRHEMTVADHVALLEGLRELSGYVVLSGYPAQLYDDALPDWRRVEREALADGARPRTEVLWINPMCAAALDAVHERPQKLKEEQLNMTLSEVAS